MRRWAARAAGVLAGVVFALLLVGCGGPDTEGQTLAEARQTLADAGVPEENITLTGAEAADGDPNDLTVCDQEPDAASPGDDVTLEVATTCLEEDDDGRKRRSFGGRRGRR